jgi:hypothetical protein
MAIHREHVPVVNHEKRTTERSTPISGNAKPVAPVSCVSGEIVLKECDVLLVMAAASLAS